jgi:hypothetical protein
MQGGTSCTAIVWGLLSIAEACSLLNAKAVYNAAAVLSCCALHENNRKKGGPCHSPDPVALPGCTLHECLCCRVRSAGANSTRSRPGGALVTGVWPDLVLETAHASRIAVGGTGSAPQKSLQNRRRFDLPLCAVAPPATSYIKVYSEADTGMHCCIAVPPTSSSHCREGPSRCSPSMPGSSQSMHRLWTPRCMT